MLNLIYIITSELVFPICIVLLLSPFIWFLIEKRDQTEAFFLFLITSLVLTLSLHAGSQNPAILLYPSNPVLSLVYKYGGLIELSIFFCWSSVVLITWVLLPPKLLKSVVADFVFCVSMFLCIAVSYLFIVDTIFLHVCSSLSIVVKYGLVALHHLKIFILDNYDLHHFRNFDLGLRLVTLILIVSIFGLILLIEINFFKYCLTPEHKVLLKEFPIKLKMTITRFFKGKS